MVSLTAELQAAARVQILDCLANYARAVDRKQWDMVRNSFHDDAYDDHGPFKGTVSGFIEWVSERHRNVPQSMHVLSNTLIEFVSAERALVETYFVSYKVIALEPDGSGGSSFASSRVLGRYIDIFEHRDKWAIVRRTVISEAAAMENSLLPLPPGSTLARRDEHDPLIVARRELGLTT